ncbi:MAG: carboxymuconolactone decarboxylase family protein [Salinibacter sp.]
MTRLAQALLRGSSSLAPGERELIAAYTSAQNECEFCAGSHSATARHLLGDDAEVVGQVLEEGVEEADLDEKMKALLCIADKVRRDARSVSEEDVDRARKHGAGDKAIHDTVLIAAAFCMYNRYVDGLDTPTPDDEAAYEEHGEDLATNGYTSVVE